METKKTGGVQSSAKKSVGTGSQSKSLVKPTTASSETILPTDMEVKEEAKDSSSSGVVAVKEQSTSTKRPVNWSCVQGISQILIALGVIAMVALMVVGCAVEMPEKMPTWTYIPSVSLKEGLEFLFHPETETVDVVKDEEILKSLGEGDTYAFMPYRYLISVVYDEELVLVLNQTEELARFVLE